MQHRRSKNADDLPELIAIFPLTGALLLPAAPLPLHIFEPRYIEMVDNLLGGSRIFGMIQPRDGDETQLYHVGCAGRITAFSETDEGNYFIWLHGLSRFRIVEEIHTDTPYRLAQVSYHDFSHDRDDENTDQIDRTRLDHAAKHYLDTEGAQEQWESIKDAPTRTLINSLAMTCPFAANEKQALLEAPTLFERSQCLTALMEMASASENDDGPLQ